MDALGKSCVAQSATICSDHFSSTSFSQSSSFKKRLLPTVAPRIQKLNEAFLANRNINFFNRKSVDEEKFGKLTSKIIAKFYNTQDFNNSGHKLESGREKIENASVDTTNRNNEENITGNSAVNFKCVHSKESDAICTKKVSNQNFC